MFDSHIWQNDLDFEKPAESIVPSTRLDGLGIQTTLIANPAMGVIERRRGTFLTFPNGHPKDPNELSEAGYYYEGRVSFF